MEVGDADDAAVDDVPLVVVDPEPDADDDEVTGVIVPATDIGDTVKGVTDNEVGVGVVSVDWPRAVEVGVEVGVVLGVVLTPMAWRIPATPVSVVEVEAGEVEDGVAVEVPDDNPVDVPPAADDPVPDVTTLLPEVEGVVVDVEVAVAVGDGVGLGVGVGVGAFTM